MGRGRTVPTGWRECWTTWASPPRVALPPLAWNTARHLELYFAAPCSGRVLHTLNLRLFPEQLTYIVNHAEDEVIFVDRSLLGLLVPRVGEFNTVKHIVVMDDGVPNEIPSFDGGPEVHDYEELLAGAERTSSAAPTSGPPPRCVTPPARRVTPRASPTPIGPPTCTRWLPCWPTRSG